MRWCRMSAASTPQRREPVPFVMIVCHPTVAHEHRSRLCPAANRPTSCRTCCRPGAQPRLIKHHEYWSAFGVAFSPPITAPMQLPLIVYSHGLSGSPIGKGYINVMAQLAAQGFMVAAVFHGDARFSRVRLEDFGDYIYALTQFDRVAEMMLMRPVSLKAGHGSAPRTEWVLAGHRHRTIGRLRRQHGRPSRWPTCSARR
jgi:hypothetical protein